ncbi:MFS transporter [Paenibacillus piscarius]|uniref:MFS transporter n=1 Tax=Paenibacillus piscarius TaxID=1089681 RepID=UPI001EE88878|nr:MFS transporter [Paenibacillus piscarius]
MKMTAREAGLLATLCFLVLMGVSNAVLFNVALPSIVAELQLTTTKASLIITCYTCIISIGALTYSKLSEHIQIRTLFLTGISLLVGGSILGYLTHHYLLLIAARVIQAGGGSCFVPLSMITVSHYLRPAHRKLGLTLISSMMTLGSGTGFLLGGVMTSFFGWHSLFLFMVLIALGFLGIYAFMPGDYLREDPNRQPFDIPGAAMVMLMVVSFLLAISLNLWLFFITIIMIVLMKRYARKDVKSPFADIHILKLKPFQRLLAATSLNSASIVAVLYLFPLLLTHTYSISPVQIGLILFATAFFNVGTNLMAGRLLLIWTPTRLISIFSLAAIAGFVLMAQGAHTSLPLLVAALACIYIGNCAVQIGLNHSVPRTVPAASGAAGFGLFNLINFIGMAAGPALSSRMLSLNSPYWAIFLVFAAVVTLIPMIIRTDEPAATASEITVPR